MKNSEKSVSIGYVEQAIAASQDPLSPPISISCNGTLAKWRGKFQFLDLRVNDPGLKKYQREFREMIAKASTLGIETFVTLPQFSTVLFDLPPSDPEKEGQTRKKNDKKPTKLVYFKSAFLAISRAFEGSPSFLRLSVEDCLPIMQMAAETGVKNVIVPVSEPGQYLDRMAEEEFEKSFKILDEFAKTRGITLHLRNGGLSERFFMQMKKKYGCYLAYNVGIAHMECDDVLAVYQKSKDFMKILMLHQVLPGIDRWETRRSTLEKSLKNYVTARNDYRQAIAEGESEYSQNCLKKFQTALTEFYEAFKNSHANLGLFQNGDLNFVPLLKEIRKDLDNGDAKYLLLETVPNTRNSDFIFRYLMTDSFSSSF